VLLPDEIFKARGAPFSGYRQVSHFQPLLRKRKKRLG